MDKTEIEQEENQGWKEKLRYWAIMSCVIFSLLFLLVMLFYGTIFTTECDFVKFITFQCSF